MLQVGGVLNMFVHFSCGDRQSLKPSLEIVVCTVSEVFDLTADEVYLLEKGEDLRILHVLRIHTFFDQIALNPKNRVAGKVR